jgi:hypothetical protein
VPAVRTERVSDQRCLVRLAPERAVAAAAELLAR